METIMQKAVEGGYIQKPREMTYLEHIEKYRNNVLDFKLSILEQDFWKSLGQACDWTTGTGLFEAKTDGTPAKELLTCNFHALDFYNTALMDGWDVAIEQLLKLIEEVL